MIMATLLTGIDTNSFDVKTLEVPQPKFEDQIGFFITTSTPIEIYEITQPNGVKDPFTI